jgi:hypothetical protein
MGLFDTLSALFTLFIQFIMALYGLFLLVLTFISRLLFRTPVDSEAILPQITPPPENPPAAIPGPMYWELIKSVLLWGSLIVLVIVALRQYIAFNRDLSEELRRFRPLRWFFTVWGRFKASFKKANRSVGDFLRKSLKRLHNMGPEPAGTGKWDFINPHRLTTRQKVIFYYLALVRRAREAGFPRQEDQTPYEYALSLKSSLTEEKDNVDAMTESFIEARYSRHEIPAKVARRAESIWETIRSVLKNRSKNSP